MSSEKSDQLAETSEPQENNYELNQTSKEVIEIYNYAKDGTTKKQKEETTVEGERISVASEGENVEIVDSGTEGEEDTISAKFFDSVPQREHTNSIKGMSQIAIVDEEEQETARPTYSVELKSETQARESAAAQSDTPSRLKLESKKFRFSAGPKASTTPSLVQRGSQRGSGWLARLSRGTSSIYDDAGRFSVGADNIQYDIAPRITSEDDITEFFQDDTKDTVVQFFPPDQIDQLECLEEEAEEEQESFDRRPYYERFSELTNMINVRQARNYALNKKLDTFCKRRGIVDHEKFGESSKRYSNEKAYFNKLQMCGEVIQVSTIVRATHTRTMEDRKNMRREKANQSESLFAALQDRESKIGYGLINTKDGTVISDKLVSRLLRQQAFYMNQVCSMRVVFIKLKNRVDFTLAKIYQLEYRGPNLHLADYEQLKLKNRSFTDKIEEKDAELAKLRYICQTSIQRLAHIREKSEAFEVDVDEARNELHDVIEDNLSLREAINKIKHDRDNYRHSTHKLIQETGLLTHSTLLIDMEQSQIEYGQDAAQLETLKLTYNTNANDLRILRKKIERHTELKRKNKLMENIPVKAKFLKRKPRLNKEFAARKVSLPDPVIDESALIQPGKINSKFSLNDVFVQKVKFSEI